MWLKELGKPWREATHPPPCAPGSAGSWLRSSIPSRPRCCQRSLSQASAHQTSPQHKCASGCHKHIALCSHPTVLQTSHLTLQEKNREVSKMTNTRKRWNQSPKMASLKENLNLLQHSHLTAWGKQSERGEHSLFCIAKTVLAALGLTPSLGLVLFPKSPGLLQSELDWRIPWCLHL